MKLLRGAGAGGGGGAGTGAGVGAGDGSAAGAGGGAGAASGVMSARNFSSLCSLLAKPWKLQALQVMTASCFALSVYRALTEPHTGQRPVPSLTDSPTVSPPSRGCAQTGTGPARGPAAA